MRLYHTLLVLLFMSLYLFMFGIALNVHVDHDIGCKCTSEELCRSGIIDNS